MEKTLQAYQFDLDELHQEALVTIIEEHGALIYRGVCIIYTEMLFEPKTEALRAFNYHLRFLYQQGIEKLCIILENN